MDGKRKAPEDEPITPEEWSRLWLQCMQPTAVREALFEKMGSVSVETRVQLDRFIFGSSSQSVANLPVFLHASECENLKAIIEHALHVAMTHAQNQRAVLYSLAVDALQETVDSQWSRHADPIKKKHRRETAAIFESACENVSTAEEVASHSGQPSFADSTFTAEPISLVDEPGQASAHQPSVDSITMALISRRPTGQGPMEDFSQILSKKGSRRLSEVYATSFHCAPQGKDHIAFAVETLKMEEMLNQIDAPRSAFEEGNLFPDSTMSA